MADRRSLRRLSACADRLKLVASPARSVLPSAAVNTSTASDGSTRFRRPQVDGRCGAGSGAAAGDRRSAGRPTRRRRRHRPAALAARLGRGHRALRLRGGGRSRLSRRPTHHAVSSALFVIDAVLAIPACLSLWIRRRHPVAVGWAAVGLALVSDASAGAALVALFTVAVHCAAAADAAAVGVLRRGGRVRVVIYSAGHQRLAGRSRSGWCGDRGGRFRPVRAGTA